MKHESIDSLAKHIQCCRGSLQRMNSEKDSNRRQHALLVPIMFHLTCTSTKELCHGACILHVRSAPFYAKYEHWRLYFQLSLETITVLFKSGTRPRTAQLLRVLALESTVLVQVRLLTRTTCSSFLDLYSHHFIYILYTVYIIGI